MSTRCPLSSDYYEIVETLTDETRRARTPHTCDECREVIATKTQYRYFTGTLDGGVFSHRRCLPCYEIQTHFDCGGYVFGALWDELAENFFPTMTAGGPCMEGLSAAAKEKLFARWRRWKGLE